MNQMRYYDMTHTNSAEFRESCLNQQAITIRPDDAVIEQEFVRLLSPQSKFLRFFAPIKELSPSALKEFHTNGLP